MKNLIIFILLLITAVTFSQDRTLILGKSQTGVFSMTNITNSPLDSASYSGSAEMQYEITIKTGSTDSGGVVTVDYVNIETRRGFTKMLNAGSKDTLSVSGLRLCFNDTLATGDKARVMNRLNVPVSIDSTGGLFDARWDYAKVDTVTTISATPDTMLLSQDYSFGLFIYADADLQFRTNRISGWVFVPAGSYVSLPIRHTSSDTLFSKSATIPDLMVIRGK